MKIIFQKRKGTEMVEHAINYGLKKGQPNLKFSSCKLSVSGVFAKFWNATQNNSINIMHVFLKIYII